MLLLALLAAKLPAVLAEHTAEAHPSQLPEAGILTKQLLQEPVGIFHLAIWLEYPVGFALERPTCNNSEGLRLAMPPTRARTM
jgi:hypothetical protein